MVAMLPNIDKAELFKRGLKRASSWLERHNLPRPHRIFSSREEANRWRRHFMPPTWYGLYLNERRSTALVVNVKRCRVATRVPGWSWSYPGYKSDLTPYGVVCHEFGHHVDYVLGARGGLISNRKIWKAVVANEEEVSGYEPNHAEAFAEAFRLFLTNPSLLREGRPERWEFMTHTLGLDPPNTTSWRIVLKHAHPQIVRAAEKWVGEK